MIPKRTDVAYGRRVAVVGQLRIQLRFAELPVQMRGSRRHSAILRRAVSLATFLINFDRDLRSHSLRSIAPYQYSWQAANRSRNGDRRSITPRRKTLGCVSRPATAGRARGNAAEINLSAAVNCPLRGSDRASGKPTGSA